MRGKKKGVRKSYFRKKPQVVRLIGGETICHCGKAFPAAKACNGRAISWCSDDCKFEVRAQAERDRRRAAKTEQGKLAAAASKAKRESLGGQQSAWRDPKFNRVAVCRKPCECRNYSACSDKSIYGLLWKYEENGGKYCWEAPIAGPQGLSIGISGECRTLLARGTTRLGA